MYRGHESKEAYERYYSDIANYVHEVPMMEQYVKEAEMERKELEMSNETTKACNLTEDEVKVLLSHHGFALGNENTDIKVERISYLNKRLKAFSEPTEEKQSPSAPATTAATNETKWGAPSNG